jgi:hypothetical protein
MSNETFPAAGGNAPPFFLTAWSLPRKGSSDRQLEPVDMADARVWTLHEPGPDDDPRCRIVLIMAQDRWFCSDPIATGWFIFPDGGPQGLRCQWIGRPPHLGILVTASVPPPDTQLIELSVQGALLLCNLYRTTPPPELIAAWRAWTASRGAEPPAVPESLPPPPPRAAAPAPSVDWADWVEQAVTWLGRATVQIALIRFLAARDNRQADLATLTREVRHRKCSRKDDISATRRLAERTRDALEAGNCPLRLTISGSVVRLITASPGSTPSV